MPILNASLDHEVLGNCRSDEGRAVVAINLQYSRLGVPLTRGRGDHRHLSTVFFVGFHVPPH